MVKGVLKAQCKKCFKVLYDDKWLFGRMNITLPNVAQITCKPCIAGEVKRLMHDHGIKLIG